MDESLDNRISALEELNKSMSNSGLGGTGSVRMRGSVLPNKIAKPKMSNNSRSSKIKIPSVGQSSKKDPLKSIQQTHNKDVKDIRMKEAMSSIPKISSLSKIDDLEARLDKLEKALNLDILNKADGPHDKDEMIVALRQLHAKTNHPEVKKQIEQAISDRMTQLSSNFVVVKGPGDKKPKKIMINPGPKGETPDQKEKRLASEAKAREERRQADEMARKLESDPEFKQRALDYAAPQIKEIEEKKAQEMRDKWAEERKQKEADMLYEKWVNEVDPDRVQEGGQAGKKRNAKRMNMLEARKERPHRLAQQAFDANPEVKEAFKPDPNAKLDDEDSTPPEFNLLNDSQKLGKINDRLTFIEELVKSDSFKNKPFATGKIGRKMYVLKQKIKAIDYIKEKYPDKDPNKLIPPSQPNKSKSSKMRKSRCWDGYEPVPGKKAYEKGSCRPKGSKKKACKCKGKGCSCK